jgi:hypothetical protein
MAMQSEPLESEQGSTQNDDNRVDLTAIAAAHPVNQKTAVLDLNTFDATQLTLLEVLDMAEVTGVEPELLGTLLSGRQTTKRMRMLYAMAWCIARRADPAVRFAEVCTWKLEIIGETDPARIERAGKRTAMIVGAADVSGLHPDEAAQLTVAELAAYGDRRSRSNRAARRKAHAR